MNWHLLSEADRAALPLVTKFLEGRLEERETVNWALTLRADKAVKRQGILWLAHRDGDDKPKEPWLTAWRLIEEFWENEKADPSSLGEFDIKTRFKAGELTSQLIADLSKLARPRLEITSLSEQRTKPIPARPNTVEDIFTAKVTSMGVIDPREFRIQQIDDANFLSQLARSLEIDVDHGLSLAKQLGWETKKHSWRLGFLHRVYYVRDLPNSANEEPDRFDTGLAPAVKLLHAVVSRLAEIEPEIARGLVRGWLLRDIGVFKRLWAAVSFTGVSSDYEVSDFFETLTPEEFWYLDSYPEFTELRARRFGTLRPQTKAKVLARIRRGPPRSLWRKDAEADRVANARAYWSARELARIESAGAEIPARDLDWLNNAKQKFPELVDMRIDHDLNMGVQVYRRGAKPDTRFDDLSGDERLIELEKALGRGRTFGDDPAEQAGDWLRTGSNTIAIIRELAADDSDRQYPRIWERVGWAHSTADRELTPAQANEEAELVLAQLMKLPDATISAAIEGITYWMTGWDTRLARPMDIAPLWFKVWPLAVAATNRQTEKDGAADYLGTSGDSVGDHEPMDLDTLNTAAGRLVGVFLDLCPPINKSSAPFRKNAVLRRMRDRQDKAKGRAGLIAKYRAIEAMAYFMRADPTRVTEVLIPALDGPGKVARVLWRAVARQRLSLVVVRRIGRRMATRVLDPALSRDTRNHLIFRLIVETLYATFEGREPVLPAPELQSILRRLDPEVRAHAADALSQFLSENGGGDLGTNEEIFTRAIAPFLANVWPQDRDLIGPGTAKSFADIPAAARGRFVDAEKAIRRLLVPFQCWTLSEYGLYQGGGELPGLALIDDEAKAEALLDLFDLTIGTADDATVPHDLGSALARIAEVAPSQKQTKQYRRLAAAARV